jgi:hypothetical protein
MHPLPLSYSLEIVCTHLPITTIAMQTLQTPRCSFLTWIKIFTIPLAIIKVSLFLCEMDLSVVAIIILLKRLADFGVPRRLFRRVFRGHFFIVCNELFAQEGSILNLMLYGDSRVSSEGSLVEKASLPFRPYSNHN